MQHNASDIVGMWKFVLKIVLIQSLLLLLMAHSSESTHFTEPLSLQALYKKNDTEKGIVNALPRPPRRNDKAMKDDTPRGASKYSYYYLGRSVTYFILFYLGWFTLYFIAHILRSIYLHRVSPPPGSSFGYPQIVHPVKKRDTYLNHLTSNVLTLIDSYKTNTAKDIKRNIN